MYLRVVRNTLARRAVEGTDFECLDEAFMGPTLLALSIEDPGSAARVHEGFRKRPRRSKSKRWRSAESCWVPNSSIALAKLPTLDEARAMLMGTMLAPVRSWRDLQRGPRQAGAHHRSVRIQKNQEAACHRSRKRENVRRPHTTVIIGDISNGISKDDILNAIAEMSVMDVVELVKAMEDKFGVSAAAAVAAAAAAAAGDAGELPPRRRRVRRRPRGFGEKKVNVIKAVRAITGLGLKEAKAWSTARPSVKEGRASKDEAEDIKKQIEEAGGNCRAQVNAQHDWNDAGPPGPTPKAGVSPFPRSDATPRARIARDPPPQNLARASLKSRRISNP